MLKAGEKRKQRDTQQSGPSYLSLCLAHVYVRLVKILKFLTPYEQSGHH